MLADEALRVGGVGASENVRPPLAELRGTSVVQVGRGVEADTRVPVLTFVPGEELLAEAASVLLAPELAGKVRAVLESLELGLRVRVVVADVGPGLALGDPEVSQQQRHRFGGHGGAVVGVDGQLVGIDPVLANAVREQSLCQG